MRVYSDNEPSAFSIVRIERKGIAEIRLTSDIRRIDSETGKYVYNEYIKCVDMRDDLDAYVESNYRDWLAQYRDIDAAAKTIEAMAQREKLLAETDWTQVLDAPISQKSREAYRAYRQQLRDITEHEDFPYIIDWPEPPEKVKAEPDPVDEAFDLLVGGGNDA